MRKENYKDEVNFTEEQIKIDRRRDPAMIREVFLERCLSRELRKKCTKKGI